MPAPSPQRLRPAVFFDRDNTLIVGDDYLGDPAAVRLMDGAADAVARLRRLGFTIVVVSNQSGVARGTFAEDDVRAVNRRLDQVLRLANPAALIDRHEYCPHHPEATVDAYRRPCDCRKPLPGMILRAADEMGLDRSRSWLVGDAPRDVEAGHAAGCRTILFTAPGLPASPAASAAARAASAVTPDAMVDTLTEAAEMIAHATNPAGPVPGGPLPTADAGETLRQLLIEVRRLADTHDRRGDFAPTLLIAGVAQMLVLATAFGAYLDPDHRGALLLTAILTQLIVATAVSYQRP